MSQSRTAGPGNRKEPELSPLVSRAGARQDRIRIRCFASEIYTDMREPEQRGLAILAVQQRFSGCQYPTFSPLQGLLTYPVPAAPGSASLTIPAQIRSMIDLPLFLARNSGLANLTALSPQSAGRKALRVDVIYVRNGCLADRLGRHPMSIFRGPVFVAAMSQTPKMLSWEKLNPGSLRFCLGTA